MSSLSVPNEVIGANTVSINRLGLECCDDMQGAQMGECEVDSHDMSRPDKGYLSAPLITSLIFTCPPKALTSRAIRVQLLWIFESRYCCSCCLSVQYFQIWQLCATVFQDMCLIQSFTLIRVEKLQKHKLDPHRTLKLSTKNNIMQR